MTGFVPPPPCLCNSIHQVHWDCGPILILFQFLPSLYQCVTCLPLLTTFKSKSFWTSALKMSGIQSHRAKVVNPRFKPKRKQCIFFIVNCFCAFYSNRTFSNERRISMVGILRPVASDHITQMKTHIHII